MDEDEVVDKHLEYLKSINKGVAMLTWLVFALVLIGISFYFR